MQIEFWQLSQSKAEAIKALQYMPLAYDLKEFL